VEQFAGGSVDLVDAATQQDGLHERGRSCSGGVSCS
jgi:hypothetical protein